MKDLEINNKLSKYQLEVNNLIEDFLKSKRAPAELLDVFNYCLIPAGKLLRPAIVCAFEESLGIEHGRLDGFKLAIEMTHVASLIHDDLPALDNDDIRRGRASAHIAFSESKALLAGDLMLVKAFECLYARSFKSVHDTQLSDLSSLHDSSVLLPVLIDAQIKLCEGQVAELRLMEKFPNIFLFKALNSSEKADIINLFEAISLKKTGALFKACAIAPALLSNQSQDYLKLVEKLMSSFSLAFQLRDDLLDSIHDNEDSDQEKEINYVTVLGENEAKRYLDRLVQDTISSLDKLGASYEGLRRLLLGVLEN